MVSLRNQCLLILAAGAIAMPSLRAKPVATHITLDGSLGHAGAITSNGHIYTILPSVGKSVGSNLFESFGQFDLGFGDTADFQSGGAINIVARVTGGSPSTIAGTLESNANLFFLNPAGVMFNRGAQLDVKGAFATSTSNYITLSDGSIFHADTSHLTADANLTSAPVSSFGFLAGVTPAPISVEGANLTNANGSMEFVGGAFTAGGGSQLSVTSASLGIFSGGEVSAQGDAAVTSLTSLGNSNGATGFVQLGAVQIGDSTGGATVQSSGRTGKVNIRGGQIAVGTTSAVVANGGGAVSVLASQSANVAGTVAAPGANTLDGVGGSVVVSAPDLTFASTALVEASGNAGGGTIYLGGGPHGCDVSVPDALTTTVESGAQIVADSLHTGNGGRVVVWSDEDTEYNGSISAQGGSASGNGGNVEVSGGYLNFQGEVSTLAPHGQAGTLLLDPVSIDIGNNDDAQYTPLPPYSAGGTTITSQTGAATLGDETSEISWATIELALAKGDVAITTDYSGANLNNASDPGNITVSANETYTSAHNLTLTANNDTQTVNSNTDTGLGGILLNGSITNKGAGNLTLNAGSGGVKVNSNLSFTNGNVTITTTGAVTETAATISAKSLTIDKAAGITLSQSNNIAEISFSDNSPTSGSPMGIAFDNQGALQIDSAVENGGGNIDISTSGAITVESGANATIQGGQNTITLTSTGSHGGIELIGAITDEDSAQGPAGTVVLASSGDISDDGGKGSITAADLQTISVGGTTLGGSNELGSYQGTNTGGGDIVFNNTGALGITSIQQTGGGKVTVINDGAITVESGDTVSLDGGQLTMDSSKSSPASGIAVDGAIANLAGTVVLAAGAGITEDEVNGSIEATNLVTSSVGGTNLANQGANEVTTFSAKENGGSITFANSGDIKIGSVTYTSDQSGLNVTQSGIADANGSVVLTTTGAISESGSAIITANSLATTSGNGTTLNNNNNINNFSATDADNKAIALTDAGGATLGIGAISTQGDVFLTTTAAGINFSDAVNLGNGSLTISSAGEVDQGNNSIAGNTLTLQGAGNYVLADATNAFGTLDLDSATGEIRYDSGVSSLNVLAGGSGFTKLDIEAPAETINVEDSLGGTDVQMNCKVLAIAQTKNITASTINIVATDHLVLGNKVVTPPTGSVVYNATDYQNYIKQPKNFGIAIAEEVNRNGEGGGGGGSMSSVPSPVGSLSVTSDNPNYTPIQISPGSALDEVILDGSLGASGPITPDTSLTYNVTDNDGVQVGSNLFLSFGELNLGSDETLNLNVDSSVNAPVQNVFIRVTSGQPSIIEGNLLADFNTNVTKASIYLLNPYGIVLYDANQSNLSTANGATAKGVGITISGNSANLVPSLILSTATSIDLGSASSPTLFYTVHNAADSAITPGNANYAGAVAGFGFDSSLLPPATIQSTSKTGYVLDGSAYYSISLEDSALFAASNSVPLGTIEIVGGNILSSGSYISANNIVLVSATAPPVTMDGSSPSTTGQAIPFSGQTTIGVNSDETSGILSLPQGALATMGNITIENESGVNSYEGIIQISGKQFTLNGSVVVDQLTDADADPDSQVLIQASSVDIETDQTSGSSDSFILTANLSSANVGNTNRAIDVNVYADDLTINGNYNASSNTQNVGILASAQPIDAFFTGAATNDAPSGYLPVSYTNYGSGTGNSGNINLYVGNTLTLESGGLLNAVANGPGSGGTVLITAPSAVQATALGISQAYPTVLISGGKINTSASIVASPSQSTVPNFSQTGAAGNVNITANQITVNSSYYPTGEGSNTAVPGQILSSSGSIDPYSLDNASSLTGAGGEIVMDLVNDGIFEMDGLGKSTPLISAATYTASKGGDVYLDTSGNVSISGGAQIVVSTIGEGNSGVAYIGVNTPPSSITISGSGSGVFAEEEAGSTGSGGSFGTQFATVALMAGEVTLSNGATVDSSTAGSGNAGSVYLSATGAVQLTSGATISAGTSAGGNGGNVYIETPGAVLISGGSTVSVSSSGTDPNNSLSGGVYVGAFTPLFTSTPPVPVSVTIDGSNSNGSMTGIFATVSNQGSGATTAVLINTGELTLENNATINSSTSGYGAAGGIQLNVGPQEFPEATGAIQLSNGATIDASSSSMSSAPGASAIGGSVVINTPGALSITGGSQIIVSTSGNFDSGSVQIGQQNEVPVSIMINGVGSGILATASGAGSGLSPAIQITTGGLTIENGGTIDSSTSGPGDAGDITIAVDGANGGTGDFQATQGAEVFALSDATSGEGGSAGSITITQTNSTDLTDPQEGTHGGVWIDDSSVWAYNNSTSATYSGTALAMAKGSVTINAQELTVSNGGYISAGTTGIYPGGDVTIQAGSVEVTGAGTQISAGNSDPTTDPTAAIGIAGSISIEQCSSLVVDQFGVVSTNAAATYNAVPLSIMVNGKAVPNPAAVGGAITINAQNVTLQNDGTISAETGGAYNGGSITINNTDGSSPALSVQVLSGGFIVASTTGAGDGGTIGIDAASVKVSGYDSFDLPSEVAAGNGQPTDSLGNPINSPVGKAGSISITGCATLLVDDYGLITTDSAATNASIPLDSSAAKGGGDIMINAQAVTVQNDAEISAETGGVYDGGSVTIQGLEGQSAAQSVQVLSGGFIDASSMGEGDGGSVSITAASILVSGVDESGQYFSSVSAGSGPGVEQQDNGTYGQAGSIKITGCNTLLVTQDGEISTDNSALNNSSALTGGGQINISAQTVTVGTGGDILATTEGCYSGGSITIQTGALKVTGFDQYGYVSEISAGTAGSGNGGKILINVQGVAGNQVETGDIAITNGGQILASSTGNGETGQVDGEAGQIVIIQQDSQDLKTNPNAGLFIDGTNGSTIASSESDMNNPIVSGNTSADIDILAQRITMTNGADISASTANGYDGGSITILDPGLLFITKGSVIDASSMAASNGGSPGDISIDEIKVPVGDTSNAFDTFNTTVDQVSGFVAPQAHFVLTGQGKTYYDNYYYTPAKALDLLYGSSIRSDSQSGPQGGGIVINASGVDIEHNSSVEAYNKAMSSENFIASDITIDAGASFYLNDYSAILTYAPDASGGNITIDPQFVVLNHSIINAFGGSENGDVYIQSDYTLAGDSGITASGEVTIDSILLNLSGALVVLPENLIDESKRLKESCARAIQHDFSSLIVVGRGGTETAPDELNSDNSLDPIIHAGSKTGVMGKSLR